MDDRALPELAAGEIANTRAAVHAYAGILGALLKNARKRRKHWWHASIRPSLRGLTTGVIFADVNYEVELDLAHSRLTLKTADRLTISEALTGQPAGELAATLSAALAAVGAGDTLSDQQFDESKSFPAYAAGQAQDMHSALLFVAACLEDFRAGIREETSPIQLWPHHFDLSMVWLPGDKVPDVDPADEESSDKQMNFGFTFGDSNIEDPYFYVTAYPLPDALPELALPGPAKWHSGGFSGAVLRYSALRKLPKPRAALAELWSGLLKAYPSQAQ